MSLCVILLTLTSAFCFVTSQEHREGGEGVINTMMSGGDVPSSSILNAIGSDGGTIGRTMSGTADRPLRGEVDFEVADPSAGPMKKFTLSKVQGMIEGMKNGFRYRYDGTPSTMEEEVTITMDQLLAMEAQLRGTQPATAPVTGSAKKMFTLDEVRAMLDGMNAGLRYNHQGQVTTVTEEVVYTIVELEHMMTELQTQEQVLQQFPLSDLQRMTEGMEAGGLQYNYRGQLAKEGEPTLSLPQLKQVTQEKQAQSGLTGPTDIQTKPVVLPVDAIGGLTGPTDIQTKPVVLPVDAIGGLTGPTDIQTKPVVLPVDTIGGLTGPTDIQTKPVVLPVDAIGGLTGPTDIQTKPVVLPVDAIGGLTGPTDIQTKPVVLPVDAIGGLTGPTDIQTKPVVLPVDTIGGLTGPTDIQTKPVVLPVDAIGGLTGPRDIQTKPAVLPVNDLGLKSIAQFTLDQIRNMIAGTERGSRYNYQGEPSLPGEDTLTMGQLQRFMNEILSQGTMPTADFTREDLDRMIQGINNGLQYNFQGQMALPGQAVLTRERINELINKLDAKGPMNAGMQTPNFSVDDLRRMIQGMDNGIVYNYQGQEAKQGDPTLSRGYLNRLLSQLVPQQGGTGSLPLQTASFTMGDINRMLTGMNGGLRYNYQGVEAQPGEVTLTRQQLNDFLADLRAKGMGNFLQTPLFTLDDVNKMLAGMEIGLKYNYQGIVAKPGEATLTRTQLTGIRSNIQPTSSMGHSFQSASFTLNDVNRMLRGMDMGLFFNYQGVVAGPGEITLTRQQLNSLLAKLQASGAGQSLQTAPFTLADINRMLAGMDNGLFFNYKGDVAKSGDETLTRQQLNDFLADFRAKGIGQSFPTALFTLDDVNRMLKGMDRNLSYNYRGIVAKPGEITLTRQQLNGFLEELRAKGMGQPLRTASFTLEDVNRMLSGMDRNLRYNYQGVVAQPGEITLTRQQLNGFLADLKTKGMGQTLRTAQFTIHDVNRMLTGMDQGLFYNYQGVVANPGEVTLTRQQLNGFKSDLQAKGMGQALPTNSFTLEDINEMLIGMDIGLTYNYRGVLATPGEVTFTRQQLNNFKLNLPANGMGNRPLTPSFTLDEVDKMIAGMDTGLTYNFRGVVAQPGEELLTRDRLNELRKMLGGTGMTGGTSWQTPTFTMDDINKMLTGMDNGLFYNYRGVVASQGEPTLTRGQLNQLLRNIPAGGMGSGTSLQTPSFTMDDINKMLTGMDTGLSYNYQGVVASQGEPTLTRGQLNQFLKDLRDKGMGEGTSWQTPTFTMGQINEMLTGMDNGLFYNYRGVVASQGEPTLTRAQLNQFLRNLPASGGTSMQTGSFTIDDINKMLTGMDTGLSYNYQGVVASQGEPTLTRGQLNKFLKDLRDKGMGEGTSWQTPTFTMDEINRMLTGMDNGLFYNYRGVVASQGEPTLTRGQLNKFLRDLSAMAPAQTADFTVSDVERMIAGMQLGDKYNYRGSLAVAGEPVLTIDQLNELFRQLNTAPGVDASSPMVFENIFTSESASTSSSSSSKTLVIIDTPVREGSNVVDINFVAKGGPDSLNVPIKPNVPTRPNEIVKSTDETKVTHIERFDPNTANPDAVAPPQTNLQTDQILSENVLSKNVDETVVNEVSKQVTDQTGSTQKIKKESVELDLTGLRNIQIGDLADEIGTVNIIIGGAPIPKSETGTDTVTTSDTNISNVVKDISATNIQTTGVTVSKITADFTLDEVNRMIDGINQGLSYNNQGLPANEGDDVLTLDQLNKYITDRKLRGPKDKFAQFTREEINRMVDGIGRGESFNYKGAPPTPGEQTLTLDDLNRLLKKLDSPGGPVVGVTGPVVGTGGVPDRTSQFTIADIDRMIDGMKNGEKFNYEGLPAAVGDPILSMEKLNEVLNHLQQVSGQALDIPLDRFTRRDINDMIAGINRGVSYNYLGLAPAPGEKLLTMDDLNRLLSRFDSQGSQALDIPLDRFTRQDINDMIAGINRGVSYNYLGLAPAPGEKLLTMDDLNRLLSRFDSQGSQALDIPLDRFTRQDINDMIAGINRGVSYNYLGLAPAPGEKLLTMDDLNRLLTRFDSQGSQALDIPIDRFTRQDINDMIAGINRGVSYNYLGLAPAPGEKLLTMDDLNRLLSRFDSQGSQALDIPLDRFTRQDINDMIAGINRGVSYNYLGLAPAPGEKLLTMDDLNRLLSRFDSQGSQALDIPLDRFTRRDINDMIAGINRGVSYNYLGLAPAPGEKLLTMDDLNRLLSRFDSQGSQALDIPLDRFTRQDINDMIAGINRGVSYNYLGLAPAPGEKLLTMDDLNRLRSRLDLQGTQALDIPIDRFTRQDINDMIAGINRGVSYNYLGLAPAPGEKLLTMDDLNRLRSRLDSQGIVLPMIKFPADEINRMIEGIRNGKAYNYEGLPASPGEKMLTIEDLKKQLADLNINLQLVGVDAERFTLDQIERMLAGMDTGLVYNIHGQVARLGEQTLTRKQLNAFYTTLSGGHHTFLMTNITIDESRFTIDELKEMLRGMEQGQMYNYHGQLAAADQPTLTRDQLNRLLFTLEYKRTKSTFTTTFTLSQIITMLEGMDRGLRYNYQGREAGPGVPAITRDDLNFMLIDSLASRYNRNDIERMLAGFDRGEMYNYEGKLATSGEPTLTKGQLNRMSFTIEYKRPQTSTKTRFTVNQIQNMLDGMNKGLRYDYQGLEAGPGVPAMSRDELTVILFDLLASRYNRNDIERMLKGMDQGEMYNFEGKLATAGQPTLTRNQLNRLWFTIEYKTKPTSTKRTFTEAEIQQLLDGMDSGLYYNYNGKVAASGEPTLTRNELMNDLFDLLASRFNREDINRMLSGLDTGDSYNYNGNLATGGERTLTRDNLNQLLNLLGSGQQPTTRPFTLDQIKTMLTGMDTGTSYNNLGIEAGVGETALTREELIVYLLDLLASMFTVDDVNRMLSGIGRGEAYNFEGRPAKTGEPILEREILNRVLPKLGQPDTTQRNFTQGELIQMLDGMGRGISYNRQGIEAKEGETTFNRKELQVLLYNMLADKYTLDDLYNMLDTMDRGTMFSIDGTKAVDGDVIWHRDILEELLIYLLGSKYENVAARKPAELSSVFNSKWSADKGTDENRDGNMFADSCFHTNEEARPFFIVDLGGIYDLKSLVMFNREDCCGDRAKNLTVSTGFSKVDMNVENVIAGPIGRWYILQFTPGTLARYVKIQSREDTPLPLHLCEIEIYGTKSNDLYPNIALNKPAEMSSSFDSRWTADKGVDGNTSQNAFENSCFHTGQDMNPYFIIDLQAVYDINRVKLFNRLDCCDDRARDIDILTGLTRDDFESRAFMAGPLASEKEIELVPSTEAQYVKIQMRSNAPEYMHLCEVQVQGDFIREDSCRGIVPPCQNGGFCTNLGGVNNCRCPQGWTGPTCAEKVYPNVALNKRAELSSLFDQQYSADKGIDGDTSQVMTAGSCFHTLNETEPYFIIDLRSVYDINNIVIYNRQDCCNERAKNVEISTGLTREKFLPREYLAGPLDSRTDVLLKRPNEAQFVKIQIKGPDPTYFHLCEVEVRGVFIRDDSCAGIVPPCKNGGICTNLGGVHNCICTDGWTGTDCSKRARQNIAFGKATEMSSNFNDKWTSDKAVDGNTNTNIVANSCFHTREEVNPYWMVDLGAVYDVDQIEVYNRADCCSERLYDVALLTGLTRDDLIVQEYLRGPLQVPATVSLQPKARAQFIQLKHLNNTPATLHVCEVVVNGDFVRDDSCRGIVPPCKNGGYCTNLGGDINCRCIDGWIGTDCSQKDLCATSPCLNGGTCTNMLGNLCICASGWLGPRCQISIDNIAYNKPTELSSLFRNDPKYGGDKGVDGNSNGNMALGSCFHTEKERQPYWMVNLGGVYDLNRIVLHNRQDSGMERAKDVEILVGLTKDSVKPVYFHTGEIGAIQRVRFPAGTEGQYVMVHIKDLHPEFLHLCEVEIYGNFLREDLCKRNPCKNGGTCTNIQGRGICICPPGYRGRLCRRDESFIRSTPPTVTDVPEPKWNGSRIDPAICRRAQCNLPICYVPYTNDCAKYVVCQRTAIGTYVAWKMRCAFGSYWGTGRTWTCERVEDLAKQGYVCPNDRCANNSLITYPDEDLSNCRTYWRCENGVSKPACCPPGRAFSRDTLQCESDPNDNCRSPCPLKLDGCMVPGSRTEPFYDGNCRTYWDCQSGHPHPVCCNQGMSYDFVLGYCKEDITCSDSCPSDYTTDICRKISGGANSVVSYALADGNCRTYMKCTKDGYDDPYCCRQDYYYNSTTGQCELLEDDYAVCRHAQCPRGYKEECRFTSIAGSPTQFFDNDAQIIRDCAPGTSFSPDICVCDGSSLTNTCKAEVWAKFDKIEDKWSVKNYGDGWISVFGDMSKNRTAQGISYGTFDGSSGMEVWRYDHTALPEVTLEITFQPVASGIDRQILVSNCMSVDNGEASFEVSLDPQSARIIFKGKTKFDAAEISLPYNRQGWNTFKLFFDGEDLVGVMEDPAGVGKTEMQTASLRGDITAGVGAMKFGPCLDSFSMPKDNGFTGFVSEVIFSKCIDVRGREFIQKHAVPEVHRYIGRN